jgi:hypothetical protein
MPIDPYTPCPGGTGKKIKFCCSDLIAELEKIQRMLDGDQRAACLDHIDSLQTKYPDRACLLSIKGMLEAELGHETKAQSTLERFREKHPENPVALAEQATILVGKTGALSAVNLMQDALDRCAQEIPPQVYDAVGLVGESLLAEGLVLAGRAHLMLQVGMSGGKDNRPLELLGRINSSPRLPILVKQDIPLEQPPEDALWKKSFTSALEPALHGSWRRAAANLSGLTIKVGDWPTIWQNIAVLRTWLGENRSATEAWRKYAAQDIPLDDAVEAEALVQLLDPDGGERVDLVSIPYEIKDIEALEARLVANARASRMPIDLARMGTESEPPPKSAFWLLDRVVPASGADLQLSGVPSIVGHVFVYGKQTDRAARMELAAYRTELAAAQDVAQEVAGDAIGSAGAEQVVSQASAVEHLLSWNWRLPPDTPETRRAELMSEKRAAVLGELWPQMPQRAFNGKTAREAAAAPALRNRVLAAILIMELAIDHGVSDFDFNALRSKLGLPTCDPIDPRQTPPPKLSLARLSRVDVKALPDEALLELFRQAEHYRHIAALRRLATEALARPGLESQLDKAEVYGVLAQTEPDTGKAIEYLDQARSAAEATKSSTAPWDLAELAMRIARGDVVEADRLMQHIRGEHMREPGVAQALYQILTEAGIIGPDGRPNLPTERGAASPLVVPGAAAESESGKIWTPGSDQPSSGKKSALWTPGME